MRKKIHLVTQIGNVFNQESANCYLNSADRLLVTLGLDNLIVVETADATLVANKQKSDQLKSIVNKLEERNLKESVLHKRIFRPWGSYTSLIEKKGWLLKIIEVNPGLKLSLQMHSHRSEHWIVVSGNAEVQLDEQKFILKNNQSTYSNWFAPQIIIQQINP